MLCKNPLFRQIWFFSWKRRTSQILGSSEIFQRNFLSLNMAWLDLDGLIKHLKYFFSYTLECNYNNGKGTNQLAPALSDNGQTTPPPSPGCPPRYTPGHYEEVNFLVFFIRPKFSFVNNFDFGFVLFIWLNNISDNISDNRFPIQIYNWILFDANQVYIKNPVKHLRCQVFVKIVNGF